MSIFRIICLAAISFGFASAFGCGTGESNVNSMAADRPSNVNAVNAVNANVPNSAAVTFSNANSINANSINANINRPMDEAMKRLEAMRVAANRSGKQIPRVNSRPAPEDSTISTTLTDFAREIRTWKKHPVLAKVEKIHDGGDGLIKVYLRNGKMIELPGKAIAQIGDVTASTVLTLAGVSQPTKVPERKDPQFRRSKK